MLCKKTILKDLKRFSSIGLVSLVSLALVGASVNTANAKRARRHTRSYRVYRHHKSYRFGYYKHGRLHYFRSGYFVNGKWHKYARRYGYGYKGYKHVMKSYKRSSRYSHRHSYRRHSQKGHAYLVNKLVPNKKSSHKKAQKKQKNNVYPVDGFDNNNTNSSNSGNSVNKVNEKQDTDDNNNSESNVNNTPSYKPSHHSNYHAPVNENTPARDITGWDFDHVPMWEVTKNDNSYYGQHRVAGYHLDTKFNMADEEQGHIDSEQGDEYNLYKINKNVMPSNMSQKANNIYNKYNVGSKSFSNGTSLKTEMSEN